MHAHRTNQGLGNGPHGHVLLPVLGQLVDDLGRPGVGVGEGEGEVVLVLLLVEGRRRIDEVVEQRIAQSIEGLGPIEGDETNATLIGVVLRETTFDENVFVLLGVGGTCG